MATQTLDANGNAIVNGYSTNLTPDQLAKSSTISSSSLAPVPTVPIASPDYKDTSSTTNTGLAYIQSASNDAQANVDALNKQGQATSSEVASLQSSQGNKSQDQATQYNTKDENGNSVNSLAGQLRKYNAQSQALNYDNLAKTLAEENKATGQNITSTAVSRNTADATRENTINIAKLAMQTAITKADYDTAKEYADQMVTAKYDKIEADIKAKLTNLAAFDKYQLTPAEAKAKTAQEALLKKQEQDVADKKADETKINDLIINASQVAPKDVVARAQAIKDAGGDSTKVAMALGQYGKDYLANQKLKLEISKLTKENTALDIKNSSDVSTANKPIVDSWVQRINEGKAKISDVPANLKNAVTVGLTSTPNNTNDPKVQVIKDKISAIDSLVSDRTLSTVVGPNMFSRGGAGAIETFNGQSANFIAGVNQLISSDTLDTLINLKAQGGTLGALSDQERIMLRNAATKISDWEIKDSDGKVVGYSIDENSFKTELNRIKTISERALANVGGSTITKTGDTSADSYFLKSSQALQNSQATTPALQGGYVDNQK